jgi:hypothetical protein
MLRNTSSLAKPQLQSNIIRGNTFAVVSMEKFNYTISDYSGRIMGRGFITAGTSTISASSLANGAYIIRFSNGNEQFVEKFVKQY